MVMVETDNKEESSAFEVLVCEVCEVCEGRPNDKNKKNRVECLQYVLSLVCCTSIRGEKHTAVRMLHPNSHPTDELNPRPFLVLCLLCYALLCHAIYAIVVIIIIVVF